MSEYCEPSGATGDPQFVATASTAATGYLNVRSGAEYCEPCTTITVTCPTATATTGTAYDAFTTASGGISPYTYAIASGSLPAGLTLNTATGEITERRPPRPPITSRFKPRMPPPVPERVPAARLLSLKAAPSRCPFR